MNTHSYRQLLDTNWVDVVSCRWLWQLWDAPQIRYGTLVYVDRYYVQNGTITTKWLPSLPLSIFFCFVYVLNQPISWQIFHNWSIRQWCCCVGMAFCSKLITNINFVSMAHKNGSNAFDWKLVLIKRNIRGSIYFSVLVEPNNDINELF